MNQVADIVLSYDKLAARIKDKPKETKRALSLLKEIQGFFNPKVVNSIARTLDFTFAKLYEGINFQEPDGKTLEELAKTDCVVLVPNHQSHVDYIALTYAVFNKYKIPLYVAGGINLNIFPVGRLLRNAGCFFIRRSFNNDILYKLTLEGYLYYLLKTGQPIEFFFEGGRSRTGKLLPPRFGLFGMILDIYKNKKAEINRPLTFIPVSIAHEYVPETKSHSKELEGRKKEKEKVSQLFKAFKLFGQKLGTIHIHLSEPIRAPETFHDARETAQKLAFDCYRQVGRNMMVTPTSLLSLILLDEGSGTLTWNQIFETADKILKYCEEFNVPMSTKLIESERLRTLKKALSQLVENGKVDIIRNDKLREDYYTIKDESRRDLLYFKNTIVHHFLVPYIISAAWVHFINDRFKDVHDLNQFLLRQRKQLKYEFYLPTVKELMFLGLKIVKRGVGKDISSIKDAMELPSKDLYKLMREIAPFSKVFNYIFEAYYISAATLKHFKEDVFTRDEFLKVSREIFELEKSHGRIIKYPESYAQPIMKTSLNYFENLKLIERADGGFKVTEQKLVDEVMEQITKHLIELLTINFKVHDS